MSRNSQSPNICDIAKKKTKSGGWRGGRMNNNEKKATIEAPVGVHVCVLAHERDRKGLSLVARREFQRDI